MRRNLNKINPKFQTIHSEEDRVWMKNDKITLCVKGGGHPEVDRIRSAHFNDLTLIIIWLFITPFWLLTAPDYTTAFFVMKLFMISKIVNTILYITSNVIQLSIILRLTSFICYSLIIFLAVNLIFYYY